MVGRTFAGSLGLVGDFDLGENGWKDDMDSNLLWLSVLTQGRVIDVLSDVLATPAQGDVIILAAGHATNPNRVAAYDEGAWKYRAPLAGWRLFNATLGVFLQFNGTAWAADTAALDAEGVRDVMAAALVSGTNVTIVPDDGSDTITFNSVDTQGAATTAEEIQDAVAAALRQGSNVTITYDDTGNTITIASAGGAPAAWQAISARYWRIRNTVAPAGNQVAMATVQFKDSLGTVISTGGVAAASNVFNNEAQYSAAGAFDADANTRWVTDGGVGLAWLSYDLGQSKAVYSVTVEAFSGALAAGMPNILVEYSSDNATWTTLKTQAMAAYAAGVQQTVTAQEAPNAGLGYRAGWFFTSALAASEIILIHPFTKAVTFPANFAGSVAKVDGTMPGAALAIDVQKNNVSVGTLSISTTGVATFTSTGGAAVVFAVGDRLKLIGPATVNTATNVSGTFEGTY